MKPFFTYFGGKYRASPRYPAPIHNVIIEPFAGAAGYSVRHGANRPVVLVEKNDKVAALWKWLIEADPSTILHLPSSGFNHVDELDVPEEAKHLIGFWLNKGTSHPCKTPSRWMRDGLRPNSFWGETIRERIASQVPLIKSWTVIHGDFSKSPEIEATWYIDPPYQLLPTQYSTRFNEYPRLAEWCMNRYGQLIVCEGEGADWLPFEPFAKIKGLEGARGGKISSEVIYYREKN